MTRGPNPEPPPSGAPGAKPATRYGGTAMQQGTLPRAAIVGAGLLGMVAVIAWFSFSRQATAPLDGYLRRGPDGAAAALKRDLQAEFPSGSQVAPIIRKLEGLGMACSLPAESRAQWECGIMVRAEMRRTIQLRVTIGTFGDKVVAIDSSATERAQ